MKKLHDLRSLLSDGALLSTMDCMRTKGGSGKRRKHLTDSSANVMDVCEPSEEVEITTTP